MGISFEFGPPSGELDPRVPATLDKWRAEVRASEAQLARMAESVGEGFTVEQGRDGRFHVEADDDDDSFEELSFGPDGGWLSKPTADLDKAEAVFGLVYSLCDQAGWVVYDPQAHAIVYGLRLVCRKCEQEIRAGEPKCPNGHPVADAIVHLPSPDVSRDGSSGSSADAAPKRREPMGSPSRPILEALVADGALELDGELGPLVARFARFLEGRLGKPSSDGALGSATSAWLLEQPEVGELFEDDAALERRIRAESSRLRA